MEEINCAKERTKQMKEMTRKYTNIKEKIVGDNRRTGGGGEGQEEEEEVVFISLPWRPRRPYGV